MIRTKIIFNISLFLSILILFFYVFSKIDKEENHIVEVLPVMKIFSNKTMKDKVIKPDYDYNLWLIFTKVVDKSPLMYNFNNLVHNLLNVSSVPLKLHIITDDNSQEIATKLINKVSNFTNKSMQFKFYDMNIFTSKIQDIVEGMMPFFSSRPGTYYSDALFYLSLGLYRIAPIEQTYAVMLDCDLYFKADVLELFLQFDGFQPGNLFGLAPELTPVYRHILHAYRRNHPNTTFGEAYNTSKKQGDVHPFGFQGYNSGIMLFNLSAIRSSKLYENVIKKESVKKLADKYMFRGHLGDQDFYTLLGYEYPEMFYTLNCGFNRQLCTWWRDKGGYMDIFDIYAKCMHKIVILHGNCNTKIPP